MKMAKNWKWLILLILLAAWTGAAVRAQGSQGSNPDDNTVIVPSRSANPHGAFNPEAAVAQGNHKYGMVKVAHIFDTFYVNLEKNVRPKRAVFDALNEDGMSVYHVDLTKPPFYAVWHQSPEHPYRIVKLHYVLYFAKGKPVERTTWLVHEPRYISVPAP